MRCVDDLSNPRAALAGRGIATVSTLEGPSKVVHTENNHFATMELVAELAA